MLIFTDEERNKIYRETLLYLNTGFSPFVCMCMKLSTGLNFGFELPNEYIAEEFPEFWNQRPEWVHSVKQIWFDTKHINKKRRILRNCINSTEKALLWQR